MTDHLHNLWPGIGGAMVSIMAGAYSFFGHSLPIVQWFAALLAIAAGAASIASVVRHWNDRRD